MGVTLKINGVDRTSYCQNQHPAFTLNAKGERGSAQFEIKVLSGGSYTPDIGQEVEWLDAGVSVWLGTIDSFQEAPKGHSGGLTYTVSAVTLEQRLDKRTVTRSFAAGSTAGSIVASIMATEAAAEGITIGNIADGVTMPSAKAYDHIKISDAFTELASLSDDYVWYVQDSALYFQPRTTVAAPFGVTGADILLSDSVSGAPNIAVSRSDYRNRQHVKIATPNLAPQQETFAGDGSTSSFTLSKPISQIVSISLTSATGSSLVGTFNANPSDMDLIQINGWDYYFVAALPAPQDVGVFTTALNYVLIGATKEDTAQHLVDCVLDTGNGKGTTYSSSSIKNLAIDTITIAGPVITVITVPGTFYGIAAHQSFTTAFTWSEPVGASDGASLPQTFAESGSGATGVQWTYGSGGTTISQTPGQSPPAVGQTLVVQYNPAGTGYVTVDNPVEIAIRAAAEGGSGIYENVAIREDLLTVDQGLAAANALLAANGAMATRITFSTQRFGLLPGQILSIASPKLGVNVSYVIQSVTGTAIGANHFCQHFRYQVLAVSGAQLQTTVQKFAALANKPSPSAAPVASASDSSGWKANFGLDDDTVGTNAANKYVPIEAEGKPVIGYVTIKALAAAGSPESIFDVLYSGDGGATWASLFDAGNENKLIVPPIKDGTTATDFVSNPLVIKFENFIDIDCIAPGLLRIDTIQGGGAVDLVFWLRGLPGGATGLTADFSNSGSSMALPLAA